jgi:uracil-DNA glycosylase family 4
MRQRLDSERRFGLDLLPRPPRKPSRAELLERLRQECEKCNRCELRTTRTHLVFGVGNPEAELMFIGEAPGADEDAQGIPFVGRAGQKLTEIIERGMRIPRTQVYIANILKCRPPGNRAPQPAEMAVCLPHLLKQIEIIQPRVIIALGGVALNGLLGSGHQISRYRGLFQDFNGIPLMPTFHPSYVLRNYTREVRQQVWDDMRKVLAKLAELKGG